jgi:adenine-specific DNA-methyltransferase
MKKLTAEDPETKSVDMIAENIASLRALFPDAFAEGQVDFDVLRQLLGDNVAGEDERYGLSWHGKRAARLLALTPSTGTLRPSQDESVDWADTRNLVIEGDNLEVLKLLQKSYIGQAKVIYIDPPYNTGRDFIYPDNFHHGISSYLELTGQLGDTGVALTSNPESSGRFHSSWLNMMLPRLRVARNLLRSDGVLIMSIDDAEVANARALLDEVFGVENFGATLVWDRNRKNDAKYFSVGHEYMLVYFKDESYLSANGVIFRGEKDGVEEVKAEFERLRAKHHDDWGKVRAELGAYLAAIPSGDSREPLKRFTKVDELGPYRDDGNINWPGGGGPRYEVLHPTTGKPCKLPVSGWRYPRPERFWEEVEAGRVVFGPDESTVPRVRTNLFENNTQVMVSVHYSYAQTAANQFTDLFDGARVFDNPKPVDDLANLVGYLSSGDDLIIDFFAGSGSTGHAVWKQNLKDNGTRRFLLVQLPEPVDPSSTGQAAAASFLKENGLALSISEITKERLRRAGSHLRDEAGPSAEGTDLGFRVFRLDSSNIQSWDPAPDDLDSSLVDAIDHLRSDRTDQDILFELLLKLGLDLTDPIEVRDFDGATVYCAGAGALMVCLAEKVDRENVEPVTSGIVGWHGELGPAGDTVVVFRDDAFADDVVKTNLTAILEQHGMSTIRSL